MFTGKRFRLRTPTVAIDVMSAEHIEVTLSEGSVINVIDGPKPDNPLLRVVCDKRWLLITEHDLRERCDEIA